MIFTLITDKGIVVWLSYWQKLGLL